MASLYTVIVDVAKVGRKEIRMTKELWEDIETVAARLLGVSAGTVTVVKAIKHDDDPGNRGGRR